MHVVVGWILTVAGAAIAVWGLVRTGQAVWIAHGKPSVGKMSPGLPRLGRAIMVPWRRLTRRHSDATVHAVTAEATLTAHGGMTVSGSRWESIDGADDVDTKIAKLSGNLEQLRETALLQDQKHAARAAQIEKASSQQAARTDDIENRMATAADAERARDDSVIPKEISGLLLAGLGQLFALAGTVLLAC